MEDHTQETFYDAKSTATDTESNGAVLEVVGGPFGSPVVDEAAGFGSPIHIASSVSPVNEAEAKGKSKKVKSTRKKRNRKKQAAAETEGLEGIESQQQCAGQDSQSTLPVKSLSKKRKQRMAVDGEVNGTKQPKKKGPKKALKDKEIEKQSPKKRSRSPQPQRKARVAQVLVTDDPCFEVGGGRGSKFRSNRKRVREGAKGPNGLRTKQLKLDKKGKSESTLNSLKRDAGDLQPIGRKCRKLQNETNPNDVGMEDA